MPRSCSRVLLLVSLLLTLAHTGDSQTPGYAGGYGIEVGLGVWLGADAGSTVTTSGATTAVTTRGFGGSLGFHHWPTEHLAVGLTAGLVNAEASVISTPSGSETQTSAVATLMLDLRYLFPLRESGSLTPYLHASAGPVFGARTSSGTSGEVVSAQTTIGGRVGAGLNAALSRLIVLGIRGTYLLMSDFSEPVGGRTSFNGAEVLFCISFVWGGERVPAE